MAIGPMAASSLRFDGNQQAVVGAVAPPARQAMQLAPSERARLLDQVIDSLDADRERDARWNALAARRDAEAEADPSLLVPGPEALARIRASRG